MTKGKGQNIDLRKNPGEKEKTKVVEYARSELRALEVLDEVCERMKEYRVTGKIGDQYKGLKKASEFLAGQSTNAGDGNQQINGKLMFGAPEGINSVGQKIKQSTREWNSLMNKCNEILEDQEDHMVNLVRFVHPDELEDTLCMRMTASCPFGENEPVI